MTTNPTDLELRILQGFHRNPWTTWFDCEKRLGITTDVPALVAAFLVKDRLVSGGCLEVFHPPIGRPSLYALTDRAVERLLELAPSGEVPDRELDDRPVNA